MLDRQLEPEVMDDPLESQAYDAMDHDSVNRCFVEDFLRFEPSPADVLDLGTGTARIPIELCRQSDSCRIMASDAASSMLDIARMNLSEEGVEHRVQLHHGDAKSLGFDDDYFGSVISNSLIHHVPDPRVVLQEMVRVTRPGGTIFVRDLLRPSSMDQVESLVSCYTANEPAESQQLFRQSLIAALTCEEMADLVSALGFDPQTVKATSDRHWTWAART